MRRSIGTAAILGAATAISLLPVRQTLAFGPEGHRTVALIADQVLQHGDAAVRAKVQALLAADKGDRLTRNDIAGEAIWADVLREKSEEARDATAAWHVTRLKPDNPDLATACFGRRPLPAGYPASHGPRENCSVDKIEQFAAELKNPETSQGEKLAALQFLLNLVGDLHDPLNAIDRGDQGGQCVALQIGEKTPVRLSSYWEATLVAEVVGSDPAKGAQRIAAAVPAADARKLAEGNAEAWARETFEIAKTVTYGFAGEPAAGKHEFPARKGEREACASVALYRVSPEYETRALAAVKQQLARAGIRLAAMLRGSLR